MSLRHRAVWRAWAPALLLLGLAGTVAGQSQYDRSLQAVRTFSGVPGFEVDYAAPRVYDERGPANLARTWLQPWYQQGEDYSRQPYQRYVDHRLEGTLAYDAFGQSIGRAWHVYSWTQEQPGPRGSFIDKRRRFNSVGSSPGSSGFSAYDSFFRSLVIASDASGGASYRLTIGDAIYSSFTPLTFYKPRFNGVRLDAAGPNVSATLLMSRPSDPDDVPLSNSTSLLGGHAEARLLPGVSLGLTYVNTHNVLTQIDFDDGNPLHGTLTANHNSALEAIWVRVRDDSPGRGLEGVKLAGYDVVLTDTTGRQFRGQEIGFLPTVEGGRAQAGRLIAQDEDAIVLMYDLQSIPHDSLTSGALRSVRVDLSVANDYRVEVASDLQTDSEDFNPEIVYLPVARSPRNVQDNSNSRIVSVDYGLPTGNDIMGVDLNILTEEATVRAEVARNRRFRRYPNPGIDTHHQMVDQALAAYVQGLWRLGRAQLFGEGFSIDDDYTTRYWLTDGRGRMAFRSPIPQVFEYVDDDDDNDAVPEWRRPHHDFDNTAWPGFDENRDFVNDHNQNGNLIPDYREPFLRYASDPPEYLFGYDMNHNGMIDRFENDDLPDYPYRGDHRGYNLYGALPLGPNLEWLIGRQRVWLIDGDGRTRSTYTTLQWQGGGPRIRPRLFLSGARVRDDIADDLFVWSQPLGAPGRMEERRDPLPGLDTWTSTIYADLETKFDNGVRTLHRVKWDRVQQEDPTALVRAREGRPTSGFFGVINKAEWVIPAGLAYVEPRLKSAYRHVRPYSTRQTTGSALEETATLLWTQPIFAESVGVSYFPRYGRGIFQSQVQIGLELSRLWLLDGTLADADEDRTDITGVLQLTNRSAYQGYNLVTRLGVLVAQTHFESSPRTRSSQFFLSVHAGLR